MQMEFLGEVMLVECKICGKKIIENNRNELILKMREHAEEHYNMRNLPAIIMRELEENQKQRLGVLE